MGTYAYAQKYFYPFSTDFTTIGVKTLMSLSVDTFARTRNLPLVPFARGLGLSQFTYLLLSNM